jgi:hypothetical protein
VYISGIHANCPKHVFKSAVMDVLNKYKDEESSTQNVFLLPNRIVVSQPIWNVKNDNKFERFYFILMIIFFKQTNFFIIFIIIIIICVYKKSMLHSSNSYIFIFNLTKTQKCMDSDAKRSIREDRHTIAERLESECSWCRGSRNRRLPHRQQLHHQRRAKHSAHEY